MNTQRSPISHCPVHFSKLLLLIDSPSVCQFTLLPDYPSSAWISEIAQDRHKKRKNVHAQGESYSHAVIIDVLPDYIFLEIFDFYQNNHDYDRTVWKRHLQVCQRWRQIVFALPHSLNLQIFCTDNTSVRKYLGIWPALPLVIYYRNSGRSKRPRGEGSVIAALKHPDRVRDIDLEIMGSQLVRIAKVMKKPFPVLAGLFISSSDRNAPVLPAEFLGGSAPCLHTINIEGIPFPALPTFLLSTSDLVTLHVRNIPPTGYISPEAMVMGLAVLPKLKTFTIEFQSATPRPDQTHPPPVTRTVLPSLTIFEFKGTSEYLENLVAEIDSPMLDRVAIVYLNQLVDFQVAQVSKFIDRSVGPKFALYGHAEVFFHRDWVSFTVSPCATRSSSDWRPARTIISCEGINWQVSHIDQVLGQFSATISTIVHLKLDANNDSRFQGTHDLEWQHLLHQFSTVQTLHVSRVFAAHVSLALEYITGEMVVKVLPSLDLIYLEGQPSSSIEKFIAARQRSGRPVTVISKEKEFEGRLKTYVSN